MAESREIPDSIARARRTLDGLVGIELLGDWEWREAAKRWTLGCQLQISEKGNGIPAETEWFILVTDQYPWGSVKVMPANKGGIAQTYQHQSYNGRTSADGSWRTGDLCLNTTVHVLRRTGLNIEPYTVDDRLVWHVQRAIQWLIAAATSRLSVSGDPFELPQYPHQESGQFAFSEGPSSFANWRSIQSHCGLVELMRHDLPRECLVVQRFLDIAGDAIYTAVWGDELNESKVNGRGLWLRLASLPILVPWQAPYTWGELRAACQAQSIDLDRTLKLLLVAYRMHRPTVLLLGFPIPRLIGGENARYQWQAIRLPQLAGSKTEVPGFRPGSTGQWVHDRTGPLNDGARVQWMVSENWDVNEISTRGRLPEGLRDQRVLLIGAGALGAPVAELLVRGGVQSVVVVDEGEIEIGNLVRHTADMDNLSGRKAHVLVHRLRKVSPHVTAHPVYATFPLLKPEDEQKAQTCEIVIDCTGEDALIPTLAEFKWESAETQIFSLSIGMEARRLFCYHAQAGMFTEAEFREAVAPWLLKQAEEYDDVELPREGVGCWHPVFPARADDIWLMAVWAVKEIERVLLRSRARSGLTVFEQERDAEGDPIGVRRRSS